MMVEYRPDMRNGMNLDELFDVVTKMIAHPHTAIVEHDKRRAAQVFLAFDDYLIDHLEGYCGDDWIRGRLKK